MGIAFSTAEMYKVYNNGLYTFTQICTLYMI